MAQIPEQEKNNVMAGAVVEPAEEPDWVQVILSVCGRTEPELGRLAGEDEDAFMDEMADLAERTLDRAAISYNEGICFGQFCQEGDTIQTVFQLQAE